MIIHSSAPRSLLLSGSSPADQVNVADNNCHARHPTVTVVADRTARVNVFCAMN